MDDDPSTGETWDSNGRLDVPFGIEDYAAAHINSNHNDAKSDFADSQGRKHSWTGCRRNIPRIPGFIAPYEIIGEVRVSGTFSRNLMVFAVLNSQT
jgi:hypothetical protein